MSYFLFFFFNLRILRGSEDSLIFSSNLWWRHVRTKDVRAGGEIFQMSSVSIGTGFSVSIETWLCVFYRDAVAKILYSLLFCWLTERINGRVYPRSEALSISILDIYGFEVKLKKDLASCCYCSAWAVFTNHSPMHPVFVLQELQVNSFEQLCINYANETLQFFFNRVIFQEEQVRGTKLIFSYLCFPTENGFLCQKDV